MTVFPTAGRWSGCLCRLCQRSVLAAVWDVARLWMAGSIPTNVEDLERC